MSINAVAQTSKYIFLSAINSDQMHLADIKSIVVHKKERQIDTIVLNSVISQKAEGVQIRLNVVTVLQTKKSQLT